MVSKDRFTVEKVTDRLPSARRTLRRVLNASDNQEESDATASAEADLLKAVDAALASGSKEIERLNRIVDDAESRLRGVRQVLESSDRGDSSAEDGFLVLLDDIVSDLKEGLDGSRGVASTFNIVFFGRTGAGKSTLLSALGRLSGELVSDGRSDFTTDVRPLDWHGCRLYDTPGINGWGRTMAQADLEEAARRAAEVADIVLLCFDSQGPQAAEFRKVAEWVRAYRKPAIAVFNMRNSSWRHPARVSAPAHRIGLAETVRQHADNISSELAAIGLPGLPIVAINSQRALFARAATPFVGAAAQGLETERATHGLDYLDRWSNLPVLEQLISACVVEGAGDLRVAALREGFQSKLRDLADEADFVADRQQQRGIALEREIATWLDVLGYPDEKQAGVELLVRLEDARGEPYTAPVSGRLKGHAGQLVKAYLHPHRVRSLRAAEDLILEAFDEKRRVPNAEFEDRVFDAERLAESSTSVCEQAGAFLAANLELAGEDTRIEISLIDRSILDIEGRAGRHRRWLANAQRILGTLGTGIAAAIPVIVAANLWNPGGWAAAAAAAAFAFGGWLLNTSGRWTRKGAERKRVASRAKAVADARAAVSAYYEEFEGQQLASIMSGSWRAAAPLLTTQLRAALHTRRGCSALVAEAAWFRGEADLLPLPPSPADVIQRASDRVLAESDGWKPPDLDALFLGEDWLTDATGAAEPAQLAERDVDRFTSATDAARAELSMNLLHKLDAHRAGSIRQWLEAAAASSVLDQMARDELHASIALLGAPTSVVVLGDYSSGKTTLIKRMLADSGVPTPIDLHVGAGKTTSAVKSYEFGPMMLVDSPGLQGGTDRHDAAAMAALHDAALVIVVLHVNLLIGDTSRLRQHLLGDETRVGKAGRTLFVIGRIDEIGADPLRVPSDFLARRQRKVDELRDLLASLHLDVDPGQIFAISADPFGTVRDRAPAVSADYASAHRVWDGVRALCDPLLELEPEQLASMSAGAALDRARSALRSQRRRLELECVEFDEMHASTQRLAELLKTARFELELLMTSVEQRARRVVDDHVDELLAEALGAGPDEADALSEQLDVWWDDPRLASALEVLYEEAASSIEDWRKRHSSQFDRELRRYEFEMDRRGSSTIEDGFASGKGIGVAAGFVRGVHGIGKALGNREAVYAIGKAMGAKFKPWGAVKLGAKASRAAAVLGVVAVGADIAELVVDWRKEKGRDQARLAAVDDLRSEAEAFVTRLLNQADGPMDYMKDLDNEVNESLSQLAEQSELQQRAALAAAERQSGADGLLKAADEMADVHTERVMR